MQNREMNIVIVGHVDHGKSTVIGRLLADTNSLPKGKLEAVRELCRRTNKPFEYAFLLDALKDERSQGITIDAARCFFKTEKRKYIIIDAPGHIEFLKNMITGASHADAALLVIDAREGISENSRRHGYMLSMLGIKQVAVLVNKLDLFEIHERKGAYDNVVKDFTEFLSKIDITASCYIPISAVLGENIASYGESMPWYKGETVLQTLDSFYHSEKADGLPFRMWVQDVYKFTAGNDDRRIIAGTVSSGVLNTGDEIMLLPSGKKTFVKSIETFNECPKTSVSAGYAAGFCMSEQIYAKRGELITIIGQKAPLTGSRIKASVFWLGKKPLSEGKTYKLKIGTFQVGCEIEKILGVLNASTLESSEKTKANRHEVAQCILHLHRPAAFDISSGISETERFVIVDDYEISGGGIITELLGDERLSEKLNIRNIKWHKSSITSAERERYYRQRAQMILITGAVSVDKKTVARNLEKTLLKDGKIAYYMGIGNMLYGVNADIKSESSMLSEEERTEHIRRLGELCNIILDAGIILVVTASDIKQDELDTLRTIIRTDEVLTVWIGTPKARSKDFDMYFKKDEDVAESLLEFVRETNTVETE
ncbi:MAG: adenylyl-sulfate kinase [Clostridiales bacterium]|jgi:bifunctional enzyme CysN/CysC|nr:adenylyl-sulfate kinase [Clostridiales bacterium]